MKEEVIRQQKVILFDGICNLCNGIVIFILKHEKEPAFRFASIQSEAGREILEWCGLPGDFTEAIVFSDRGTIYLGSTAALKIGVHLRFPWWLLSHAGFIIPKPVRDWAYRQTAQHR